jgi:hypothetical protein
MLANRLNATGAATGAIELSLRHESTGRPEHLYRWGDGPSEEVTPPLGSAS